MRADVAPRFWARVDKSGECWEWTGPKGANGYGRVYLGGYITGLTHRVSYELAVGPIPDGLHLDHLCRNRSCVNPAHLEPVTPRENTRRGEPASRTRCPAGHQYTPENTLLRKCGRRMCRACDNGRRRAARAARAAR